MKMASRMGSYPGTPHQQALLARLVNHYQNDPRMRAVCLFGSLVRGSADGYSDLDLDAVIADDVQIDVLAELQALGQAFQPLDDPLLIVPRGTDAGDMVLASLAELSIRYHTLADTSPNIVDSLQVLTGTIDLDMIKSAGLANRQPLRQVSSHDVDDFLRHALEVHIMLRRERFWLAEHLLQRMRAKLIEIFAVSRGYGRVYHAFDLYADANLKASLGQSLPRYDLASVQTALAQTLDFLEHHLAVLSNGRLQLTDLQHQALAKIRQRWDGSI